MTRIIVTGGAGFIGSNFVPYVLKKHPAYRVINIDCLTYAGNLENLTAIENNPNYVFYKTDITDRVAIAEIFVKENIGESDYCVNFAAESHVDRSIENPGIFITTNIIGTQVLLDACKTSGIKKYLQVSTDEVYGSLGATGSFTETTPLAPNSPYSASKTGADCMVRAYFETFGLPVNITRCSNNYGPYQFPEKLIPLIISNTLEDKNLPVYGDGLQIRDWLHVTDHCEAIDCVLHSAKVGEVYNIGGKNEKANIDIVKLILHTLGKSESLIRYVTDRLGHDRRYAIDAGKIKRDLDWEPKYTFEQGIKETIQWYLDNRKWWEDIKSGEYTRYYETMYSAR
ncbi:MAG: dTDP-glucose 4,6-dehydratase [Negativicutes bacterium]|jgi:dTDP-glucose 4,6-dehydratase